MVFSTKILKPFDESTFISLACKDAGEQIIASDF